MVRIGLSVFSIALFAGVSAQKPVIDFNAIDQWPYIPSASNSLDNAGKFCSYYISNRPVGGRTLVVESTEGAWCKEYPNAKTCAFAQDNVHFLYQDAGDTLWIVDLGTDGARKIVHVLSWRLSPQGWLVFRTHSDKYRLVVHSLGNGQERTFDNVHNYVLDHKGDLLLIDTAGGQEESDVLELMGPGVGRVQPIWHSKVKGDKVENITFSDDDDALVFTETGKREQATSNSIWYYEKGKSAAVALVSSDDIERTDPGLMISDAQPVFDRAGGRVFFYLSKIKELQLNTTKAGIDVLNYKDLLLPVEEAIFHMVMNRKNFLTVINVRNNLSGEKRYVRLETDSQAVITGVQYNGYVGKYMVVEGLKGTDRHYRMTKDSLPVIYRISMDDGRRDWIKVNVKYTALQLQSYFSFSDGGRFLLWFSIPQKAYFSYELETGTLKNITWQIPVSLFDQRAASGQTLPSSDPTPLGPWLRGDSAVMLYDNYDIWEVDPRGERKPVNITNGYGRRHNLQFGIVATDNRSNAIEGDKGLLLSAFDPENKHNGFYRAGHAVNEDPEMLSMGPYISYLSVNQLHYEAGLTFATPIKAKSADVWLTSQGSATSATNIYLTKDFRTFKAMTDLQPQARYNWLTAELVRWQMTDGKRSEGILYKPENFDPGKKYPIIFTFYKRQSTLLYMFPTPDYSIASIDVAYFVSRGYIVFVPDIYYEVNEIGKSVVNAVVSAALYLTKRYPWIDAKRMGVSGQSFGGYEVNYLVSHSHVFAAAAECCGLSDFVSDYGDINDHKNAYGLKVAYYRLNATLWQNPAIWIENSPIFSADKVTTPLLILHNTLDPAVSFNQGIEWYTALWQLHKPAWLLQYDGSGHGVTNPKDFPDFTLRLNQFFDYYLMNKPPPKWMTVGVPPEMKGIESGLEIDSSGRKP